MNSFFLAPLDDWNDRLELHPLAIGHTRDVALPPVPSLGDVALPPGSSVGEMDLLMQKRGNGKRIHYHRCFLNPVSCF